MNRAGRYDFAILCFLSLTDWFGIAMASETHSSASHSEELVALTALVGESISELHSLGGGRNSRVVYFKTASGSELVAKKYFSQRSDSRDRFGVELQALEFMSQSGITCIPKIVAKDPETRSLVMEYVPGEQAVNELTSADIKQLVEFVAELQNSATEEAALSLPVASEASFSLTSLLQNLELRFSLLEKALEEALPGTVPYRCREFFSSELSPFYSTIKQDTLDRILKNGESPSEELPLPLRTLSPSDLGFHNAILTAEGRWIFQDFEYFGWDDPVKLIVDVVLHPGMSLSPDLAKYFVAQVLPQFQAKDPGLRHRVRRMYPFLGLKWCCILLNEFLPAAAARRRFAAADTVSGDVEVLLDNQLAKSNLMLEKTKGRYQRLAEEYGI